METILTKEAHALMSKQMQKEKSKTLSIINGEEVICKLHSVVLEEEEFEGLLSLFSEDELKLPNNTKTELIDVLAHYFYCREINNLSFYFIFDLLSLSILFKLKTLIDRIMDFLQSNVADLNRVCFIMKQIAPFTFQDIPNSNSKFRLILDDCQRFLLTEKFYEEFFAFFNGELFTYKVDVEAELLHHIILIKEVSTEEGLILHLMHIFKEQLLVFKREKGIDFDHSIFFEKVIEANIDLSKIDQKTFNEYKVKLNVRNKDFEMKILAQKISFFEHEKNKLMTFKEE